MKEGHIFTDFEIGDDYKQILQAQLANIGVVDKIVHHISSPGGSVYAGYEAYHLLKSLNKPIKSIIEGQAQSMATFVAMAGEEIIILDPSRWMIHNPSQGIRGDAKTLRTTADELTRIEDEMAQIYSVRTKKPVDTIKKMMSEETRMTAKEAVDFGFGTSTIDKVLEKDIYNNLKAVALGKEMEDDKNLLQQGIDKIQAMIESALKPKGDNQTAPKALELAGADGKMYNVQTENGDLVGKPITVDGTPAPDGTYKLADGRALVCAGGVVTKVEEAMTAEQKQMADMQAKLAAVEQEKATLAQQVQVTKAAADEAAKQLTTTATALGDIKKEFEVLKNKTVGDDNAPGKGDFSFMTPVAYGGSKDEQRTAIYATRTFLADNMPHLERFYQNGKYKDGSRFSDYRTGGPSAVSILETNISYTWPGILSTELFYKPTLSSPALSDIFTVDLGAADKKQYHIVPVMNKVLKPYTGCGQAVTGSSFDITSKPMQLKPFEMYEGWCKDDFTNQLSGQYNVLAQEWLKTGTESFDPAGTPIDRIIVSSLKDALRRDIFRRVSFGDTTSSNADWNQIDGMWQSLIDQSGASNYCVYRQGSALGTGALSADTALTYFQGIYNNSSNLLKETAIDSGRGEFLVTRSVWENYYDSLVAKGSVSDSEYNNLIMGIKKLYYKGIPVIPVTIWDDFLADSANPLYSTTRHLIAFTLKDNHVLGVENTGDLNKIDSWFEKKDNKRYYRSNMTLGFLGAIHCDLTTISY